MDVFLAALISWPTVGFTVLLGFAVLYWLMVMVGALDLHLFHHDLDVSGHADVHGGHAHAGDGHEADGGHGIFAHLANFLSLGAVPITIIGSSFAFSGWMLCMLVALTIGTWGLLPGWILSLLLTGIAPIAALIATGILVRPLKRLFEKAGGAHRQGTWLVGRVARITSVTVDERFGTAVSEITGAELQLRVVVSRPGLGFKKDDQVVIVDHDRERDLYTVGPLSRDEPVAVTGQDKPAPPPPAVRRPEPPLPVDQPAAPDVTPESAAATANRQRLPQ